MKTSTICQSILALSSLLICSCDTFIYNPPPESKLERPERGSFVSTEPVTLTFSEAVEVESFAFRVWEPVLDVEGLLPDDATPIVDTCTLNSNCGEDVEVESTTNTDGGITSVHITLSPTNVARPGATVLIEVLPGLSDAEGNTTGKSIFYNVQFRAPEGRFNADPVEFQNGTYIFSAVINEPVPAVLTLISDVIVMPDGRFFTAGGEGDEINGAPKETTNPNDLIVDPTEQGWSAHIAGFVTLTEDGDRILETDPVDLFLPTDPFFVNLNQVRLDGKIVKDDEGNDFLQGSLSFESLFLRIGNIDANRIEYGGGSEDMVGIYVKPGEEPENHPFVCGDQCGAIVGECNPPDDFPDSDVCEDM